MNKKILIGSIVTAVFIALLPITSVVGVQQPQIQHNVAPSPLFEARMQQQLDTPTIKKPTQQYIGQHHRPTIFLTQRSTLNTLLGRAHRIINAKPQLFEAAIQKILSTPQAQQIIEEYDLDYAELDQELQGLLNDPTLLQQKLKETSKLVPINPKDPIPLQLSTSNPLGCFIIVLVMVPLLLTIALVIATATIITCINLGGCLENLLNGLVEGFIQELKPPDDIV